MKFVLALAASAAAVKLQKQTPNRPVSRVIQMQQDMEMPEWLSDDPECMVIQGLSWAAFQLTDANNDGGVTLGEMEDAMAFIMSVTPEEVEEGFNALAVAGDTDGNSVSEADLTAACPYLIAEAGMAVEDCYAIGILMHIADATIGDADGEYELNEIQAGFAMAQEFVEEGQDCADEAFAMVDLDADGTFEYSEFEAIMPYICDYI